MNCPKSHTLVIKINGNDVIPIRCPVIDIGGRITTKPILHNGDMWVINGAGDGMILLYDKENRSLVKVIKSEVAVFYSLDATPDEQHIVYSGTDGVHRVNLKTQELTTYNILDSKVTVSGNYMFAADNDGNVTAIKL